ncbi:hypothetical protein T01_5311 [Trichinella spiralis]|uniref:Uncharacterized protein n=1 Tax=Trichinella spiralis TaxID=6334 RepID=A0A0V1ATC5_TRISP|nr:hypothetical protein T01_5311 [Trichinella spiralis]
MQTQFVVVEKKNLARRRILLENRVSLCKQWYIFFTVMKLMFDELLTSLSNALSSSLYSEEYCFEIGRTLKQCPPFSWLNPVYEYSKKIIFHITLPYLVMICCRKGRFRCFRLTFVKLNLGSIELLQYE